MSGYNYFFLLLRCHGYLYETRIWNILLIMGFILFVGFSCKIEISSPIQCSSHVKTTDYSINEIIEYIKYMKSNYLQPKCLLQIVGHWGCSGHGIYFFRRKKLQKKGEARMPEVKNILE